jgi:Carboxypeptidase regulatory-like domain
MTRCWCRRALVAAVLVAGAGCGGGHTVEGVVTLDGKPLHWATVTFTSQDGSGRTASGVTDEDGRFRLTSVKYGDGVRPGDYKVTVTIAEPPVPVETKPGMSTPEVMGLYAKGLAERKKNPITLPKVPAVYGDPAKTPLRQRVPTDGKVLLELHGDAHT